MLLEAAYRFIYWYTNFLTWFFYSLPNAKFVKNLTQYFIASGLAHNLPESIQCAAKVRAQKFSREPPLRQCGLDVP